MSSPNHLKQPNGKARTMVDAQTIIIRRAVPDDVPAIVNLVNSHAINGEILPRSTKAVYETVDDWFVALGGSEILGCVSLLGYASGLVEVRSLVVKDRYRKLGLGSRLMDLLLKEARKRQIPTLFALTRQIPFFERFGFTISNREQFPDKVWRDCLQCPLIDACDETAMVLRLNEH